MNLGFARKLVGDLPTIRGQPHGVVNHPAWSLGHLAGRPITRQGDGLIRAAGRLTRSSRPAGYRRPTPAFPRKDEIPRDGALARANRPAVSMPIRPH
jgi:hypothetical protein